MTRLRRLTYLVLAALIAGAIWPVVTIADRWGPLVGALCSFPLDTAVVFLMGLVLAPWNDEP